MRLISEIAGNEIRLIRRVIHLLHYNRVPSAVDAFVKEAKAMPTYEHTLAVTQRYIAVAK